MNTPEYNRGYRTGHEDGFTRRDGLDLGLAPADFRDGYVRGYEAGRATREYAETHGKPTTTFRNPAHRRRVLEGR